MRSIYDPGPAHWELNYLKSLIFQFSHFLKVCLVIACYFPPKPKKLETFSEIKKSV